MKGGNLSWGALLHLSTNMWGDYLATPSEYDEKSRYRDFLRTTDAGWRAMTDSAAKAALNLVFIDVGDALVYPSHPELAIRGSWSVEKFRAELARLRKLGLEPCPKLNFSSCHDVWLKDYHRMLSTPDYYKVVADVIADLVEIFDRPRLFHIGYDEEMAAAGTGQSVMTLRQGDLWWHDVNYTIGEVAKHGVRPVVWADPIWVGRDEYLKRMTKEALQCNWYYRTDFSPAKLKWNAEFEKKGGWGETVNGAAAFKALDDAGFDQMPTCSNWAEDGCADALVKYCKDNLDPSHIKGFMTAPWNSGKPEDERVRHVDEGIRLFAAARDKHYP